MAASKKAYRADTELATLLDRAARGEFQLRIETDDKIYDVVVADPGTAEKRAISQQQFEQREGIWEDYDVESVRAALRATQGILDIVDVDTLVQQIRNDRRDDGKIRHS